MRDFYFNFLIKLWQLYKKYSTYQKLKQQKEFLKTIKKNKNKKILLWGASLFLKELSQNSNLNSYNIIGIIDNNPSLQGKFIDCYKIYSPKDLEHLEPDIIILTIVHNIENAFKQIKNIVHKYSKKIKILKLKPMKRTFNFLENFLASKILESFKKKQIKEFMKNEKKFVEIDSLKNPPKYLLVDNLNNYLNILLKTDIFNYTGEFTEDNFYICWGFKCSFFNGEAILNAYKYNKPVVFIEDAFLRSADTFANRQCPVEFKKGISFTIDYLSPYFDATSPTYLELMLNDKSLIITQEEKERARKCINKIVEKHLTKYNHQPIFEPKIGRDGVKKVLVVDQSFGDMSIKKGLANSNTFKKMLKAAIKENPNADIIVKTHPDTMAGTKSGYYQKIKERGNIYLQTEPINPISLIKYVDKVYVCTTQFGFEALLCGKEVHTFGMPFYAGWGLTIDNKKCERRTNTRTLEEIFYITYILYSKYVNPIKQSECQIEDAIDYLLDLRKKYIGY